MKRGSVDGEAGHSPVKRGTGDGRQETRDGEAGTIRDAASPGIFLNMRP